MPRSAYTGTQAAHFTGGPNATGALTRTLTLVPATGALPKEATLWFAYRIENQDTGWGSSPEAPYDDWLTAEFRATDGSPVSSLLRTGNSADTATDGPAVGSLSLSDAAGRSAPLSALGTVDLVFTAGNDARCPAHQLLDRWRAAVYDLGRSADSGSICR